MSGTKRNVDRATLLPLQLNSILQQLLRHVNHKKSTHTGAQTGYQSPHVLNCVPIAVYSQIEASLFGWISDM